MPIGNAIKPMLPPGPSAEVSAACASAVAKRDGSEGEGEGVRGGGGGASTSAVVMLGGEVKTARHVSAHPRAPARLERRLPSLTASSIRSAFHTGWPPPLVARGEASTAAAADAVEADSRMVTWNCASGVAWTTSVASRREEDSTELRAERTSSVVARGVAEEGLEVGEV